jgi:hypothetical protein
MPEIPAIRQPAQPGEPSPFPQQDAVEIRRLLHDLNNALEIIVQASYLVGAADLPADVRQWVKLLDQGVQQSAALVREMREYIRLRS